MLPPLPSSVQEIADVIGREQALYLIGQLPGCGTRSWRCCFYVPLQLSADHQLVQILGWQDAKKMVKAFGGEILQPSNCNYIYRHYRNESIRALSGATSIQDISDIFGMSPRQIRNIISSPDSHGSFLRG